MEKVFGTCPSHQLSGFRPPLPLPPPLPEPFFISANELNKEYLGCSYLQPHLIEALKEKMKAKEESLQCLHPASGFLQEKRFLVFDQCGNRTTLLSPAYLTWCWHDLNYKSSRTAGNNSINCFSSDHKDESENNNNTHEDTEEIDALLYSDEDDVDDDDEASTGRSPSFTRREFKQEQLEEDGEEEVTSSARPTKRIKLSESTSSNSERDAKP